MSDIDKVSVIIPSLNPPDTMVYVVTGLIEAGFRDIIIIDDGSDDEHYTTFEQIQELPECVVLSHPDNMGKGAALKTAFSFFQQTRTGKKGVVTMDGDGQHLNDDVVKCATALLQSDEAIVMGVRDFYNADVPMRNSIGNRMTALAFRLLFGIRLRDTQTGLRGIPTQHIPMLLGIRGNRFEYETNMLLEMKKRNIGFQEVGIATVYEEKAKRQSHYRPFADSMTILSRMIKYTTSSFISFLVDVGLFGLTIRLFGGALGVLAIPVCTVLARICSSFVNFNINRSLVFERHRSFGRQMLCYYLLAVVQMSMSAALLWLAAFLTDAGYAVGILIAFKTIIDTTLFFISYYIQRKWVFR
jgi:glycosyltransferase involved in cell wall biosynthesis